MGAAAAARPRVLRGTAPPRTVITPPRQGGAAQSCSARAVCSRPSFAAALLALLLAATAAAAPPGTSISNSAEVQFIGSAGPTTIVSNSVDVVVVPAPSRAALTLLRADTRGSMKVAQPTECLRDDGPLTLPPPLGSNGQPFALGEALPLGTATTVHGGEAVFLELVDADRNLDAAVVDSVELTVTAAGGDRETVVLAETAVDSGRFAGYVQTRAAATAVGDCVLQVERDAELSATYADPLDAADQATAAALVDPFGLVFDSQTGAPVNGARVRLVVAGSGAPAVVRGDDGVSAYAARAHHGPIGYRRGRHRVRVCARRIPLSARPRRRLSPRRRAARPLQRAVDRDRSALADVARRAVHVAAGVVRRRAHGRGSDRAGRRHSARPDRQRAIRRQEHDARRRRDWRLRAVHRDGTQCRRLCCADQRRDHGPVAGGHALPGALGAPGFGRTARPRARRRRPHLDLPLARARRTAQRRAPLRGRRHERCGRQHARQPRDGPRRRRHRIEHRQCRRAVARRAVLERGAAARPRLRRHLRHDRRHRRRRRRRPHLPRGRPLRRHRRRRQVPLRRRDAGLARRAARYDHARGATSAAALRHARAQRRQRYVYSSSISAAARSARPTSSSQSAPHRPATRA